MDKSRQTLSQHDNSNIIDKYPLSATGAGFIFGALIGFLLGKDKVQPDTYDDDETEFSDYSEEPIALDRNYDDEYGDD